MKTMAFAAVLALSTSAVAAQSVAPMPVKDPGVATLVGFLIPGGGQLYAEETKRGFLFMTGTVVAFGAGLALDVKQIPDIVFPPLFVGNTTIPAVVIPGRPANHTGPIVGSVIGAVLWISAAVDAGSSARRTNEKHSRVSLVPTPQGAAVRIAF